MSLCPTSPDYLATEALAVCEAARRAELEIEAQVTRKRRGAMGFTLTAWDPDGERNPLDCHCVYVWGDTVQQCLERFAGKLGIAYPLPLVQYATHMQKVELVNLCNHALCAPAEKTKILLGINRLTEEQAAQQLLDLRALLESRYSTRYAVVASAEFVQPTAVAA